MKTFAIIFYLVLCPCVFGQQTGEVTQQLENQLQDCHRALDPNTVFPSETCSVILSYLSPADRLGPVEEDGGFLVLSPASDGTSAAKTYYLPPKLRSEIALNQLKETIGDAQYMGADMHGLFAELAIKGINFWPRVRDVYCYYHPEQKYLELSGEEDKCPVGLTLPDEKTVERYFEGPLNLSLNYHTLLNALQAEEVESRHSQK